MHNCLCVYEVAPTSNLFYTFPWNVFKHLMSRYPISVFLELLLWNSFFVEVFSCFFIVTVCQFLAELLLLNCNCNDMQLKQTPYPDLKNMLTFL